MFMWGKYPPRFGPVAPLYKSTFQKRVRSSATSSWVAPMKVGLQERNLGCGGT